jgi:hypothetical protein
MARQLTVGDVIDLAKVLMTEKGMTLSAIRELPIYIGDDDELNGIHCGWECRILDADDEEDEYFVDMINEDRGNFKLTGRDSAILIY